MEIRSLTRGEARERAALLDVRRYDIAVDLSGVPSGPEVRCTSTTTFTCRQPGASTFVDCAADVVAATLNGTPLAPPEHGRIALTDLQAENVLVVESVQANTTQGEGVHRAVDPSDGEVYLWMSFEPDEARHVWACFDQPDLKAPHAFTVTAPAAWTVLSNAGDAEVTGDGEHRTWTFPDTPPLSVYNTVVNAGPFHGIRREAGGHDLGIYARASYADRLERDADEIFRLTEQGLAFFGEAFSMPFPQRRYDQVFVPELGGAMENFGCVTWSDWFLRSAPPTYAERELLATYLLHEMAHMWFGNIVTMRWWEDLWLNEAFADFACTWAAAEATEYVDAGAGFLLVYKLQAYLADQGPTSHPISMPVRDVAEAASIFDSITYPKGASALTQLVTYVGEERFRAGMAAYFAKHAWQNTTLQDLVDALAESSGRDLDAWRTGWLETAGVDRLVLEHDGDAHVLVATGPGGDGPRPHVVDIGSYRREGDGLVPVGTTRVEVGAARTGVDLPSADVHLVNDDDLTFATSRPDAATRDALVAHAGLLPSPLSRAVAVATVYDMLASGEATPAEMVGCLTGVLAAETSGSVVEPYLKLAGDVAESWSGDAERPALLGQVDAVCRELEGRPGRRVVALRTRARTAADLDEVARLQEEAGHDIDLHWRIMTRKAELGGETDGEVEVLLEKDPDPEAWVRALGVTAARPDADAKAEAWRRVAVERSVPIGSTSSVMVPFWRPGQDDVLAPYADRFLALLPELHRGGMIPAMAFTRRLFPLYGIDAAFLDRAADAAADGVQPVVAKTLAERSDEVRRMLRARG
ncbi:aminopeptidase N [Nocardioides guangzhouensis]|uniref:Aminopeptidase N n=1 Tax=Nocardioides guangzhouensis TaxID=2497878 RepID=A0A4Q4ZLE0_9ACTN|nr:aminopeptidase N [Nocardioides guangzhouensis]RYP88346.1 aminopeptidase N [Nocardioides guangzhouensis]